MKTIKDIALGMLMGSAFTCGAMLMMDKKTMKTVKSQMNKVIKSTNNYVDELKKEL